jgi:hypothetical protein
MIRRALILRKASCRAVTTASENAQPRKRSVYRDIFVPIPSFGFLRNGTMSPVVLWSSTCGMPKGSKCAGDAAS